MLQLHHFNVLPFPLSYSSFFYLSNAIAPSPMPSIWLHASIALGHFPAPFLFRNASYLYSVYLPLIPKRCFINVPLLSYNV